MSRRFRVGVQLHPQHARIEQLRDAWRSADHLAVDSIWVWDHFFPLYGPGDGEHFEGWTLLAAMAIETAHAHVGVLVTGNSYRNPDLLADMARTVDHLSEGRTYLGIGAGWFERDYDEYGYEFGSAGSRLRRLEQSLERIRARLPNLNPAPIGELPILIGGGGERVTLRLVAQYGDAWNSFGPPDTWARKNRVLDEWCEQVGRDPGEIERTVALNSRRELQDLEAFLEAGATHVILGMGPPYDLTPVEELLARAEG